MLIFAKYFEYNDGDQLYCMFIAKAYWNFDGSVCLFIAKYCNFKPFYYVIEVRVFLQCVSAMLILLFTVVKAKPIITSSNRIIKLSSLMVYFCIHCSDTSIAETCRESDNYFLDFFTATGYPSFEAVYLRSDKWDITSCISENMR